MKNQEFNFDGIVGPTHNYSGLSFGNLASITHDHMISNPKAAALQGLKKMKFLHDLGVPQAVLPPQDRPHLGILRMLGFSGNNSEILKQALNASPEVFYRCSSASAMWTANAATVTPSSDTFDETVHITPANLSTMFHRSIEAEFTYHLFKKIFSDETYFQVHPPLLASANLGDEGAANHTLLCPDYGESGIHLFVYDTKPFDHSTASPHRFPARQSIEASAAIARLHKIFPNHVHFIQQNPEAVDMGVFHNDVISVGDRNIFFYHEKAFVNQEAVISNLQDSFEKLCDCNLYCIEVKEKQISVEEAVASYLFNSQLVKLPDEKAALIAPIECKEMPNVHNLINELIKDKKCPINLVRYVDVRESMCNGGGPACLRLRVVLNENERASLPQGIFFSEELYNKLISWVEKFYRDSLNPEDLADPILLDTNRQALDELTKILGIGSIYSFQGAKHDLKT